MIWEREVKEHRLHGSTCAGALTWLSSLPSSSPHLQRGPLELVLSTCPSLLLHELCLATPARLFPSPSTNTLLSGSHQLWPGPGRPPVSPFLLPQNTAATPSHLNPFHYKQAFYGTSTGQQRHIEIHNGVHSSLKDELLGMDFHFNGLCQWSLPS